MRGRSFTFPIAGLSPIIAATFLMMARFGDEL
jgi:hypothetical protein